MKHFLYTSSALLLIISLLFINPTTVRADEGDRERTLEMEVNGIHVTLFSQNDWKKGQNTVTVTLMDSMGMPVRNADVEILLAPKSNGHAEAEVESAHGVEQGHSSMPGMDMGQPVEENAHNMPSHDEEKVYPILLMESEEQGVYIGETHLESSGAQEVNVMFYVDGEMLQADFVVEVPGFVSRAIVLWSFVLVNLVLIASAGIMKRQSIPVKGRK